MDALTSFRERFGQLFFKRYPSLDRFYLEQEFSKGHLSNILRGVRNPSILTLHKLADMLGIELVDFFIFPGKDKRHQVMALLSDCSEEMLDELLSRLRPKTARDREDARAGDQRPRQQPEPDQTPIS